MAKNPLFSTYRTGENRVTASMIAVFERIDIGVVERLLTASTGESTLPFVAFANQIASKDGSVPDAAISANFRYLFEVKTAVKALRKAQLVQHLSHFDGRFAQERLFVLTPDAVEPEVVAELGDRRAVWLSFRGLDQAVEELLQDGTELLAEQTRFLLHELRALMAQEGLISFEDTVIVAARHAYNEYLAQAVYVCQPGRAFRDGIEYMGFYYDSAIQPEIARISARRDNILFTEESAALLERSKDEVDRRIGALIEPLVESGGRTKGELYQVFLLSAPEDPDTMTIPHAIKNTKTDRHGKPWAWTMSQAYTRADALRQGPKTTGELEELD